MNQEKQLSEEEVQLSLEVDRKRQTAVVLVKRSSDQTLLRRFEATDLSPSGFAARFPGLEAEVVRFKRTKVVLWSEGERCFEGNGQHDFRFCTSLRDFSLVAFKKADRGLPVLSLSGWVRKPRVPASVGESKRKLKLSEIFDLVAKRNVTSKIEFQQLMQVKNLMQATYLNLLPHIHLGGVISAYGQAVMAHLGNPFSPGVFVGIANDFTPFIFPTRWMNAYRTKLFYRAQKDSFKIMGADLTLATEILAYEMDQLQEGYKIATQLIERLKVIEDHLLELEKQGKANPGTHDAITYLKKLGIIQLENAHAVAIKNKAALSEMLGLPSPEAFDGVILDPDLYRVEEGKPLASKVLVQDFLERSIELRQLDYFSAASKIELIGLFFQWLDPQGSGASGIGFNLIPQYRSGRSSLKQLDLRRTQLSLKLTQEGFSLVERANLLLEQYHRAEELFNHQLLRVGKIELSVQTALVPGFVGMVEWRSNEIEKMFFQLIEARLLMETYRAGYRILRAQIDRLLLNRQYSKFNFPPSLVGAQ